MSDARIFSCLKKEEAGKGMQVFSVVPVMWTQMM